MKEMATNAHTSFDIRLDGTDEDIRAFGEVLTKRIYDVEFEIASKIRIDRSDVCVFQEDMDTLIPEMIEAAPKGSFCVNGVIDTSFCSGQERKFKYEYKNGELKAYYSDWYVETCMDYYEDYEDFCDSFYECSEKEFARISEYEYIYLLDTEKGPVLSDKVVMKHYSPERECS